MTGVSKALHRIHKKNMLIKSVECYRERTRQETQTFKGLRKCNEETNYNKQVVKTETETNTEMKIWVHKHQSKAHLQKDWGFHRAMKSHWGTKTHQQLIKKKCRNKALRIKNTQGKNASWYSIKYTQCCVGISFFIALCLFAISTVVIEHAKMLACTINHNHTTLSHALSGDQTPD